MLWAERNRLSRCGHSLAYSRPVFEILVAASTRGLLLAGGVFATKQLAQAFVFSSTFAD